MKMTLMILTVLALGWAARANEKCMERVQALELQYGLPYTSQTLRNQIEEKFTRVYSQANDSAQSKVKVSEAYTDVVCLENITFQAILNGEFEKTN